MTDNKGVLITPSLLGLVADSGNVILSTDEATGKVSFVVGDKTVFEVSQSGYTSKPFAGFTGAAPRFSQAAVATADATATNIFTLPVPLSGVVSIAAIVTGKRVGANADGATAFVYNAATNNAGTVALVGTTGGSTLENSAGTPAVTIVANDTADTIELKVTGIASQNWAWSAQILSITVVGAT